MRHSIKGVVAALAMSAGLTASVMADVVSTQPVFTKKGRGLTVIPGDFLIDGRPQIMISDTDSLSTTLRLYDMDFVRLDDVVVPHAERLVTVETRSHTYSWPEVEVLTGATSFEASSLNEAMYRLRSAYPRSELVETKESDGGTEIYLNHEYCVLTKWNTPGVGEEYIFRLWFRFEPYDAGYPEGSGMLYTLVGTGGIPTVTTGDWDVVGSIWYPFSGVGFISDEGTHANCSLSLTQTLFNEDVEYEYISRDFEPRVSNFYETGPTISEEMIPVYRSTSYDVVCSGFSVKRADGTTIQSVKFPEDFHGSGTLDFMVLELGGRRYLCCESPDKVIIYAINGDGTGLRQVGSPIPARVFPTIVNRGEPLSIERDEDSEEAWVSVYSGDGMRRYSGGMQAGERLKTLSTDGLPGGLNIVTIEDGCHRESTKILVK